MLHKRPACASSRTGDVTRFYSWPLRAIWANRYPVDGEQSRRMLSETALEKSYVGYEYACPFFYLQKRTLLLEHSLVYS
jgi:hypothetical protein